MEQHQHQDRQDQHPARSEHRGLDDNEDHEDRHVDAATLKLLASYKVARAEVSFELAKADAYMFGHDEGKRRSHDAMTSRWDRRMKWLAQLHPTLPRVTFKGLRHTHTTLLLELGEHPNVV